MAGERSDAHTRRLNELYASLKPGDARRVEIAKLLGDDLLRCPEDAEKERRTRVEQARWAGPPGYDGPDLPRHGDKGYPEEGSAAEPTIPREVWCERCGQQATIWPLTVCHQCLLITESRVARMRTRRRYGSSSLA